MIYLYQLLYLITFWISPLRYLNGYFFKKIILQIASIAGECRSSGGCCRSIQLFNQEVPINTIKDWSNFLNQFPSYNHFKPALFNGQIQSFDCVNLSKNNRCLDYENRPDLCRNYPHSFLLSHGRTHSGCGYNVDVNQRLMKQLIPFIRSKADAFLHLN